MRTRRFLTVFLTVFAALCAQHAYAQHKGDRPAAETATRSEPRAASPRDWPGAKILVVDAVGRIGFVELRTGKVEIVREEGPEFTDLAFCPPGVLYASTFDGLFRIQKAPFRVIAIRHFGQIGLNALTCDSRGKLYGYSDHPGRGLFTLNRRTGRITSIGGGAFNVLSDGDLVFHEDRLLLSSRTRRLVALSPVDGSVQGSERHRLENLFGLVSIGPDELIGCAGTEIYRLNANTGGKVLLFNYRGSGLGPCSGATYNGNFRN